MAITRMTLAEIMARPPSINEAVFAATTEADIERHMIEDGQDPTEDLRIEDAISPASIRARLGMTQERFSALLGVPLVTLRRWEGGAAPGPAGRALLRVLAREPEAALRALDR